MTGPSTPRDANGSGGRPRLCAVITDVAAALPGGPRPAAEAQADAAAEVWQGRVRTLNRDLAEVGGPEFIGAPPFRGVYFDDPAGQFPVECLQGVPGALVTTGERLSLHLVERLVGRAGPLPKALHIATADAQEDLAKATFIAALGLPVPRELTDAAYDPFGLYRRLRGIKRASVGRSVEASASGAVALLDAVTRIESGLGPCVATTVTAAKSIPIPFETTPVGAGADRRALPFTDEATGHYNSEGALALLVQEEGHARAQGLPILARVAGHAFGTFGSSVVNRTVVADVVLRALADAQVPLDAPVLVDLYGRGNRVDDGAELAAIEAVRRTRPGVHTAYLKGDGHYVIGAHGLLGVLRLLAARGAGLPVAPLAAHPSSELLAARSQPHLQVDPTDAEHVVALAYSVHGSCIAIVFDLRHTDLGSRPDLAAEVAA